MFEKVFHGARRKAADNGKGKIFDAATTTAVAWSEACDAGGPGMGLKLRRALFDALVYRRLRAALGGQVRAAVSGSAPLDEAARPLLPRDRRTGARGLRAHRDLRRDHGEHPAAQRIGTVGPPIPGQAVRIADDGEILRRGPIVFAGYRNNPTRPPRR